MNGLPRNNKNDDHLRIARIRALGHANIRGTHRKSFEIATDSEVTQAGSCIIGVGTDTDPSALLALRGRVNITLRCGDVVEQVCARMNPFYIASDPLIVRMNPEPQHRSLCIGADKGSAALDRALIAALRAPNALLEMVIEEDRRGTRGPGVLFVVGMAIGDRRDLSPRAETTLRSVDLILAEDTHAIMMLIGEDCPRLLSLHGKNERRRLSEVLDQLNQEMRLALVSKAGMPLVLDSASLIVRAAAAEGHLIVPLPGPDAVTTALSVSGMTMSDFRFLGFLPRKADERRKCLRQISDAAYSTVLVEAPHRIVNTLEAIAETLGPRQVALCRNLTKAGEEIVRGTATDVAERLSQRDAVRGEFTLVVAGSAPVAQKELNEDLRRATENLIKAGVPTRTIADALTAASGASRRSMFAVVLAIKQTLEVTSKFC